MNRQEILDSIDGKLNTMSYCIVQSKQSEKIIDKILFSTVNNLFKLYQREGILNLDGEITSELKSFWNDVLPIWGNEVKFIEEEKFFLRRYGELPCIILQDLYNSAKKYGRKELSSKLEPVIWAIENGNFNHKNLGSIKTFYKYSTKRT